MLYYLGDRVQFLYTHVEGIVEERIEEGLYIVKLHNGTEVPAPQELLRHVGESYASATQKNPDILHGEGVMIAFEPQHGADPRYALHIINDTPYKAIFDIKVFTKYEKIKSFSKAIEPNRAVLIASILRDRLNDRLEFDIKCKQTSTAGESDWLTKNLKIKVQTFDKKVRNAPFINQNAHVYHLFEPLELQDKSVDLTQYTKKNVAKNKLNNEENRKQNAQYRAWGDTDVSKFADFPREKDLHIEKLVEDPRKLQRADILDTQMRAFDVYLRQAIRLGVQRVFVIHGKGEGILKNRIADVLRKNPNIKTFKNEYHPRYGSGATEIIFQ